MELKELVEEKIGNLSEQLDQAQEKRAEEIKNIGEAHEETKNMVQSIEESIKMQKERLDGLEKTQNRIDGNTSKPKTFKDSLSDAFEESKDDLRAMANGKMKSLNIEVKAGDMTTGNTYTGEVIEADRLSGVYFDPDRPSHVRQFIPQIPTTSDTIRYVQETAYDDGTAGQVEGQSKGQSDFDLTAKTADVKTRAAFMRLSRQMLDDTSFLTGYINQRAPKKLFIDEDNQILYGDGTGENVEGIAEVAQSYSQVLDSGTIVHKLDVLGNAIAQARAGGNGEYMANLALINPVDWYNIAFAKDGNNRYLYPEVVSGGGSLTVAGVRIVPNTAVQDDEYFVGDFNMGATMALREGVNIGFFEQDADNVTTNQVTVRIEERYGLPIHNPSAFIHDRFAAAGVS